MRQVYLDHQASTPVLPEVFDAMRPFFSQHFGNASSLHQHGLHARDALDLARARIAALIHAESPEEIIFTSDGTEAANLAIKGAAYASQRQGNHIVLAATENAPVLNSIEFLEKQGFTQSQVRVDHEGCVDPAEIRAAITDATILVCVHHVNHDIGTIQAVNEIGQVAGERGIPLFVDAEASAGWMPIDVQQMNAGLLSFSAHRFYGPKGAGILYKNRRARLAGILHGGSQEGGRRAGTENVPAIVGAGVAAEIALRELPNRSQHTGHLQRHLWRGLRGKIPHLKLNGPDPGSRRITTNLNLSAEFTEGEGVLLMCDVKGIALASSSSCVSKALKISPVLSAIGLDPGLAQSSVIVSIGQENTLDEMDYVIETFAEVVQKLRRMSPLWDEFEQGLISSAIAPAPSPQPA
jgi:cysteine desulfurase